MLNPNGLDSRIDSYVADMWFLICVSFHSRFVIICLSASQRNKRETPRRVVEGRSEASPSDRAAGNIGTTAVPLWYRVWPLFFACRSRSEEGATHSATSAIVMVKSQRPGWICFMEIVSSISLQPGGSIFRVIPSTSGRFVNCVIARVGSLSFLNDGEP